MPKTAVIALGGNSLIRDARSRQRLAYQSEIIRNICGQVVELLEVLLAEAHLLGQRKWPSSGWRWNQLTCAKIGWSVDSPMILSQCAA